MSAGKVVSNWKLVYNSFNPAEEGLRESLCTLGNGYMGTRGAAPEATTGKINYPGTYIAGVYNKLATNVSGKTIYNEDFVNCPNWLFVTFKIGDGEWFDISKAKIMYYRQELDMKRGILSRSMRVQDPLGRRTFIKTSRIVSMADPHLAAIEYEIIPENYSDWIRIRTMLDGNILNLGVERYKQLNHKHWRSANLGSFGRNGKFLEVKLSQSGISIAQASKVRLFHRQTVEEEEFKPVMRAAAMGHNRIGNEMRIFAWERHCYVLEKVAAVYTSRDQDIKDPLDSAIKRLKHAMRYDEIREAHEKAWSNLWQKFYIKIEGDHYAQQVIRLHTFHLLQTVSIHNTKIDAGFPARGLHGEAYRGHIFWDELYTLFFYDLHYPDLSKAMLMYRYRRLPGAREYAGENGYQGAMFPWQSGSTGEEETQVLHLNPMSGEWGEDHSRLQRHVSFAILYNTVQYYQRTGDLDFIVDFGAEMIFSICQFISSLVKEDRRTGRFHSYGIMGPDEFHEMLPGSGSPGLKDNSYSNVMIAWSMIKAIEIMDILPEQKRSDLCRELGITPDDIKRWDDISRRMNLIIDSKGVLAQFDGYFNLKELDWEKYRQEYGNIHRMDRILKAEGKSPDEYKLSKQADVLMLFYLFSDRVLKLIFERLGYNYSKSMMRVNYDYYSKRTSHGSTLSKVVHCMVAQRLNRPDLAMSWFKEVLDSDVNDTQGGTTPEGIHCGVMGGSIDVVLKGFAGLRLHRDRIALEPCLPQTWKSLKFRFLFDRRWFSVTISHSKITLLVHEPMSKVLAVPVEVNGTLHYVPMGRTVSVDLDNNKRIAQKK